MKSKLNIFSIVALLLAVIICFSACGGPAGKISKNVHTTYYYEDYYDDAGDEDIDENSSDAAGSDTDFYDDSGFDSGYADNSGSDTVTDTADNSLDGNENGQSNSDNGGTAENSKGDNNSGTGKPSTSLSDKTKEKLLKKIEELKKLYPEEMPLYADDEGNFAYTVIFPQQVSNELSAAVKSFRSSAQSGLDTDITLEFDSDVKETKRELLIGKTNRKLSSKLLKKIIDNRKNCADDFLLYAKDGKIAIVAESDEATIKALNWFTETFCQSRRTWTYLRNGYEFLYSPKYALPEVSIGGKSLYDFSVATPKCAEYVYGRAVDDLIDVVRNDMHCTMQRDEERFISEKCEILIGELTRKESKGVVPGKNEYIIRTVGNKLVIKGYNSVCLYYGIEKFNSLIKNAIKSNKTLTFDKSYSFTGKVNAGGTDTCQLTFGDEFDDISLSGIWSKYDGGTSGENSVLGGAIDNAGRSLCYLDDGILHMPTARNSENTKNFNESKITLKNNLWYKYGCLEVCAKMPINPAHAAIWLNGLGEVDILENFSSETGFKSNIHKWFSQNTWDGSLNYTHTALDGSAKYESARKYDIDTEKYGGNLTDDFHVYSLDWTADYFRFAVDGKTYFRYDYKDNEDEVDFFRQKLYLILVCGIGSSSYGARYVPAQHDGKVYDFQIDYVRLYQNPATDVLDYKS